MQQVLLVTKPKAAQARSQRTHMPPHAGLAYGRAKGCAPGAGPTRLSVLQVLAPQPGEHVLGACACIPSPDSVAMEGRQLQHDRDRDPSRGCFLSLFLSVSGECVPALGTL